MRTGRDDALAESAGRIADGHDDDWESPLGEGGGSEGREGLRRVARIARAWRELGVHAGDEGAPPAAVLFAWGGLEVREKLGEGSFGEVFRAWDPALDREVALKLRHPDGDEAFVRGMLAEARRLARVRHPNVLVVHGADVHDGRAGLWTELVDGETLEALLARGPLGAREAAAIGLDLCRALAAVHAAGLVHGDLKAGNVMRERGGRIVLMDFGSGREAGPGTTGAPLTGTPLSVAPEVLDGGPAGAPSDLYSLGALLFRLVTGRHPVTAGSLAELREKHARGERESLRAARPDLPGAFVLAVERALEREPARRWADAGTFEHALAEAFAPRRAAAAAPARGPRRSLGVLLATSAALLIVLSAVLWPRFAARPARPASPPARAGGAPAPAAPVPAAARTEAPAPAGAPDAHAAPVPAAPDAAASLWRLRGESRTRLEDGAVVAAGDHLFLDFLGAEPLWVYVLDEDERGQTFTLFPLAGTDLANPLAGGMPHRLPGDHAGEPFDWVVTSAGGREHVLLVASRERLAVLENLVATTAPADAGHDVRYAEVPEDAFATLRGIGGLAPAPAGTASGSRLAALAAALAARRGAGLWVRHLVLESR